MRNRLFAFAILSFAYISIVSAQSDTISVPIDNFHWVDKGVYRSSQPSSEDFSLLHTAGVKEVLNLRCYNSDDDEAKNVDIKLHRIKVRASRINEEHLLEAMRIIRDREGDIVIHCHHGSDRTGAVIAMYRIAFQDWNKEDAIAELTGEKHGFHSVFRNIPKLIREIDVEEFKKKLFIE